MEAQAWTAIGLLAATLLGVLFYLGNRIDLLGSEMRSQFQAQAARSDAMSTRIDAVAARVDELGMHLSDRIYELAVKLDDHLRWHAG
jgi:division protein CdvB (Snf7/Vps24/ESCRT-III family)